MPILNRTKAKKVSNNKKELRIKIYNSVKWVRLRDAHRMLHPMCEECKKDGRFKQMEDVHHVVSPFQFSDLNEVRYWAYEPANVISLCKECHAKKHNHR